MHITAHPDRQFCPICKAKRLHGVEFTTQDRCPVAVTKVKIERRLSARNALRDNHPGARKTLAKAHGVGALRVDDCVSIIADVKEVNIIARAIADAVICARALKRFSRRTTGNLDVSFNQIDIAQPAAIIKRDVIEGAQFEQLGVISTEQLNGIIGVCANLNL